MQYYINNIMDICSESLRVRKTEINGVRFLKMFSILDIQFKLLKWNELNLGVKSCEEVNSKSNLFQLEKGGKAHLTRAAGVHAKISVST